MVNLFSKVYRRLQVQWISVPLIQRLICPRFGSTIFSRLGRIILLKTNISMFVGGTIVGCTLLFFLYSPEIKRLESQSNISLSNENSEPIQKIELALASSLPIVTTISTQKSALYDTYMSPLRNPPKLFLTTKYSKWHPGFDMATDLGTPIYASSDGYIEKTESSQNGYGNAVYISHDGDYISLYAHMSKIIVVTGQKVTPKTIIGYVGSTGRSTGPHVHFELRKNQIPLNPNIFISSL